MKKLTKDEALAACVEASADFRKAREAYDKTGAAYEKACETYEKAIEALDKTRGAYINALTANAKA